MTETNEDPGLQMNLSWDDENELFVMSYLEGDRAIFQIKMAPPSFEKLTHDMVKTIKNYNLYQAQKYQERLNGEKEQSASTAIGGGTLPSPCSPNCYREDEPKQPQSDS